MKLTLHEILLPLRHVFRTSQGAVSLQRNLVVELEHEGCRGFGEAATTAYYKTPFESMVHALEGVRSMVEEHELDRPEGLWERVHPSLRENRFALCALDEAAHDLWGKLHGKPVYELWGLSLDRIPPSDYTIGLDSVDKMVEKLKEFPGWPVYKIKLGTPDDLRIIQELRRHTGAVFRVDANVAWSVDETLRNAAALRPLNVEFIEQPLPAGDWEGMERIHRESALPVMADESCIVEEDVDRCQGRFHAINIKLTKCGGLTPARRMIARARELGMQVMVGCMVESSVGISAIAQLLPLLDYADMDGILLIARDVAEGVRLDRGRVLFPKTPGCGITWKGPVPS